MKITIMRNIANEISSIYFDIFIIRLLSLLKILYKAVDAADYNRIRYINMKSQES